jgi:hypothetical protein
MFGCDWEYLLAYVDDIMVLSHAPHAAIDSLSQHVTFKPGSVEEPKNYLGADVFKVTVMTEAQTSQQSKYGQCQHLSMSSVRFRRLSVS